MAVDCAYGIKIIIVLASGADNVGFLRRWSVVFSADRPLHLKTGAVPIRTDFLGASRPRRSPIGSENRCGADKGGF